MDPRIRLKNRQKGPQHEEEGEDSIVLPCRVDMVNV